MAEKNTSDDLYPIYLDTVSKFDHFVMAAILAVCGYLAQSIPFAKLGFNIPTGYLISLLLFAAAAFCGFKRLEHTNQLLGHNMELLTEQENGREDRARKRRPHLREAMRLTNVYYKWRDRLLFSGFGVYLLVRIIEPYFAAK